MVFSLEQLKRTKTGDKADRLMGPLDSKSSVLYTLLKDSIQLSFKDSLYFGLINMLLLAV